MIGKGIQGSVKNRIQAGKSEIERLNSIRRTDRPDHTVQKSDVFGNSDMMVVDCDRGDSVRSVVQKRVLEQFVARSALERKLGSDQ